MYANIQYKVFVKYCRDKFQVSAILIDDYLYFSRSMSVFEEEAKNQYRNQLVWSYAHTAAFPMKSSYYISTWKVLRSLWDLFLTITYFVKSSQQVTSELGQYYVVMINQNYIPGMWVRVTTSRTHLECCRFTLDFHVD